MNTQPCIVFLPTPLPPSPSIIPIATTTHSSRHQRLQNLLPHCCPLLSLPLRWPARSLQSRRLEYIPPLTAPLSTWCATVLKASDDDSQLAAEVVSLPIAPPITIDDARAIADIINQF